MGVPTEQLTTVSPPVPLDEAELDAAVDAVVVLDATLCVAAWSGAAAELYGISSAQSLGRPFTNHVSCHPQHAHPWKLGGGSNDALGGDDQPNFMLEAAGLIDGPATHVVPSGRRIPVHVTVLPLRLSPGRRLYVLVVRDDSEQARIAASLKARLDFEVLLPTLCARFSNLTEEDLDAEIELWLARLVVALDVDRGSFAQLEADGLLVVTHTYAAPGIAPYPRGPVNASLPWMTQEFLAGRGVLMTRIPDDLPPHALEERRYFTEIGMKAGIGIPVMIGGFPVCVLTFGAFRQPRTWASDIVARLRIAGDAIANAVARRAAKRRLEEKQLELVHVGRVAAMGELASVIAHELDQPLTVIVSNAESVRNALRSDKPDLADADETLGEITDAAMRVSEIVRRERQLLRKGPPAAEPLDLNDAVREIELFIRGAARQFGARLTLELLPGLPAVCGDRVQLQQVVFNLTRNALQAMWVQPANVRTLTIGTESGTETVTLTIADSGPPADPLVLRRMFEPFYTTKPTGLGMGLAISRSIVDNHMGRIWATLNPLGGLTMHVSLPRK